MPFVMSSKSFFGNISYEFGIISNLTLISSHFTIKKFICQIGIFEQSLRIFVDIDVLDSFLILFSGVFVAVKQFHKFVKQELCVHGSGAGFGVELCGEPRVMLVADTLVGAVVHVDEIRLPVGGERLGIYGVAVVLRGDETARSAYLLHGLVVAAMTIFQFVDCGSRRLSEQLVTHADTHAGAYRGIG